MAINPWDVHPTNTMSSVSYDSFMNDHAIVDQRTRQEETLEWWFATVKEWEYLYKTILNYEEQLPSFQLNILYGEYPCNPKFRVDSGLRILDDLQQHNNYEFVKQYDLWEQNKGRFQSIGMCHRLFVNNRTVALSPRTSSIVDITRLFVSLCSLLCSGCYKSPRYRVIEHIAQHLIENIDNSWVIGKETFSTSNFLLECRGGDIRVEYRQNGKHHEGFIMNLFGKFHYPELERFFGELNGRRLTDEDIALYEMVHGCKPLFYNIEYKI